MKSEHDTTPIGWYPWFPRDFATSIAVRSMSLVARGIYRELLDIQWEHGCLTDVERLLNIIQATPEQWQEFAPYLHECFPNGRNERLNLLREEAKERKESKRLAGKKSGEMRRSKAKKPRQRTEVEQVFNNCPTEAEPNTNTNTYISSKEDMVQKQKRKKAERYKSEQAIEDAKALGVINQDLLAVLPEFVTHRHEIGYPMTERAFRLVVKKLMTVSPEVAIEAVNSAIASNYRDVYPKPQNLKKKEVGGGINQVKRIVEHLNEEYDRGLRFD
jgi:hypothetical protein